MRTPLENLKIEDARIIWKNFTGAESKFNRPGDRNFCVVIEDPDLISALKDEGWNVKPLKQRDGDEDLPQNYYIPVSVSYKIRPPKIEMHTSKATIILNEDTVSTLDFADILSIDLVLRPRKYELATGASGVKAYLKTMHVTIEEDEFGDKYAR